jgi:two-component system sensor histidine kinase CpxA
VKGIFARVLLWLFAILLLSVAGFVGSSILFAPKRMQGDRFLRRIIEYEFDGAVRAYESGRAPALREYCGRLNREVGNHYYLLDANGKDLVTGAVHKDLLSSPPPRGFPFPPPRNIRIKRVANDGRYVFVIELAVDYGPARDVLTFVWIIAVVLVLAYALAVTLARPIRQLREMVMRFGRGDLSARAHQKRRDEIGDLAAAFDEMAERIQTLLAAERRLLQDVSHELRSPLARLSFALELVRKNPASNEAFARVKKEVDRMSQLIGDLLQVTRVEGDPGLRNDEPIEIGAFLREIVEDCSLEAMARGCQILMHDDGERSLRGDRELLRSAFENVLRNAIRYTQAGQQVEVRMSGEAGQVVVAVRDFGPGVPEAELIAIFRPFHRVEQDRNRAGGGGVGLGLAIAQRAVFLHHGQIEARNAQPGLLVEIRLPA